MSSPHTLWSATAALLFTAVAAAQPADRTRAPAAPGAGLPPHETLPPPPR